MRTSPSPRSFGIFFGSLFCVYGMVSFFKVGPPSAAAPAKAAGAMALGGVCLLTAWLRPSVLRIPNDLWYRFGIVLQHILGPIFMGLFFFLFFSPLAILLRLCGSTFLDLSFRGHRETYWIHRTSERTTIQSLMNQF